MTSPLPSQAERMFHCFKIKEVNYIVISLHLHRFQIPKSLGDFKFLPLESFQVPVEAETEVVPGPLEGPHLVLHPAGQRHVLPLRRGLVGRLPHELLDQLGGGEGGGEEDCQV